MFFHVSDAKNEWDFELRRNDHDQKSVKLAVGEYCEAKLEKLAIQDELLKTKFMETRYNLITKYNFNINIFTIINIKY